MKIEVLRPLHVRRAAGDLHLKPGCPVELSDAVAVQLMTKKPDAVRPVLHPGDVVQWLSPALPKQHGEVLAVHGDGTFEVFHPLAEKLCRLPVAWITMVLSSPLSSQEGPTR